MKITLLDVDSQSRSYCYQKLMDIINRHKLPFTLVSASPESFEKEKDNRIIVIGQSLVRKYSSQINSLRKVNNQAIFLAFVPDYKLSAGFVEKLALLGIDEVFDADSTENEIKKRLVIVLHKARQASGFGGLVVLTGCKGSVGVTSVTSALGEILADSGMSVCMIDMDVEYQNLSRFLLLKTVASSEFTEILNKNRALSFEGLLSSMFELNNESSLNILVPPTISFDDLVAKEHSLRTYLDAIALMSQRFDVVILDLPFCAPFKVKDLLMNTADTILFFTAPEPTFFVNHVGLLNRYRSKLIYSTKVGLVINHVFEGGIPEKLVAQETSVTLGDSIFHTSLPFCSKGRFWAGSGRTLFGAAGSKLRSNLTLLARHVRDSLSLPEKLQFKQLNGAFKPLALPKYSGDN